MGRPVYVWTMCTCELDKEGAARAYIQRTVVTLFCGAWIIPSWGFQAGFSAAWLGYVVFLLLGYGFFVGQSFDLEAPWHSEDIWGAHDDFHVCGVLADICAFCFAIPAANKMVVAAGAAATGVVSRV